MASYYQLVVTYVLLTSLLTDNVTLNLQGCVLHPISLSCDVTNLYLTGARGRE